MQPICPVCDYGLNFLRFAVDELTEANKLLSGSAMPISDHEMEQHT